MIIYKGRKAYFIDKRKGKSYRIYDGSYGVNYIIVNNMNMTIDIHKLEKFNSK